MSKSSTRGTPRPERARFPKAARLSHGREFRLVRANGRSVQGRFLRLSAARTGALEPSRFGLITSRRVGGAVERNRVRRRLREICRLHRSFVAPGWLIVTIARPAAARAGFAEIQEEWLLLAGRLSILTGSS